VLHEDASVVKLFDQIEGNVWMLTFNGGSDNGKVIADAGT
jgi:hypothetical protein